MSPRLPSPSRPTGSASSLTQPALERGRGVRASGSAPRPSDPPGPPPEHGYPAVVGGRADDGSRSSRTARATLAAPRPENVAGPKGRRLPPHPL